MRPSAKSRSTLTNSSHQELPEWPGGYVAASPSGPSLRLLPDATIDESHHSAFLIHSPDVERPVSAYLQVTATAYVYMLGFCATQSTMKGVLRQIHGKEPYSSIALETSQCANLPPNSRAKFRRCPSSDLTRAYPQDRRRPAKTASLAYDPCARDHCGFTTVQVQLVAVTIAERVP